MKEMNKLGTDFTQGDVTGILFKFVTPFLLASVLNSIYNTVDMIIIGKYVGSVGTVAVAQGGKMLNLFTVVSTGLASGGQVLISQQVGAKQKDEINATIGTMFCMLALFSVTISILCMLFSRTILDWLNVPEESYSAALGYFLITSAGLPLVFGYNAVCSVLRGMGDSINPLKFIAVAAASNLVLDLVFIIGFDMGAVGTALATIIGQSVAFFVSLVMLYRKREQFGFDFKRSSFRIDRKKMKTMLAVGGPSAAQSAIINITQLYMMSYVNSFGLVQSAAYSIGDRIITLCNVVTQSIKQAGGAVAGQNLGARLADRARDVVRSSVKITMPVAAVLAVLSLLFPMAFFRLFTNDAGVLAYSRPFMQIAAVTYFLAVFSCSYSIITIGSGNAKLGFLSGFLDGVVFRIGLCFFFGFFLDMGVTGFFLGSNMARLAVVLVNGIYYYSGAWRKRKLLVEG
ncbi:MATE family efflux transporter [Clostridium sp. MCC353]|nr:MATE family efflux transporter [Clostridium sp. MCC353]